MIIIINFIYRIQPWSDYYCPIPSIDCGIASLQLQQVGQARVEGKYGDTETEARPNTYTHVHVHITTYPWVYTYTHQTNQTSTVLVSIPSTVLVSSPSKC
jgi:hypothetical protein